MPDGTATAHLYRPKLFTVFREGYGAALFQRDLLAGLTVAIVALPLSMAIAVASGVSPERGLYTSIIGGFLVSALAEAATRSAGPRAPSFCWSRQPEPGWDWKVCFSPSSCPA